VNGEQPGSKKQLVAKKAGLDEEALYMTSPSTCKYLLSTD